MSGALSVESRMYERCCGRGRPHSGRGQGVNRLDATVGCDWIATMKMKILLALVGTISTLAFIGCVETVGDKKTNWVPVKDTIEGRYERSVDQVHAAAVEVIKFDGTLVSESIMHSETNLVKTVEGRINQRNVWVRGEQV